MDSELRSIERLGFNDPGAMRRFRRKLRRLKITCWNGHMSRYGKRECELLHQYDGPFSAAQMRCLRCDTGLECFGPLEDLEYLHPACRHCDRFVLNRET